MSDEKCTHCGHQGLEPGFLSDRQQPTFDVWVEGELERGLLGGPKLMGRPKWIVDAHRCPQCHHLELFARHQL
ncbi:hypothetical protein HII36_02505 [Nonomuraea sp. NN258]|uniref:hypothetical protein n=1 Tax=Nonomuraea antri TaxID=2730852 RepID=UPI0015686260|nr:hypothetical protein [Nonomuraea antri]NRQ30709.1 hypothetical protein [Nonomuraea antri]